MRIVTISNYINHHQIPLAEAFLSIKGVEYTFVATTPFNQKRAAMGYKDENNSLDYVKRAYEDKNQEKIARSLNLEADIVIVGSAPDSYMRERLNKGRIVFHSSERYFKKGINLFTFPRSFASALKHLRPYQNKPLYYLCSSAYTPIDVNFFTKFKNRCFKWGYFTEVEETKVSELNQNRRHEKPVILWAGRFLDWKHPEVAILVARRLNDLGYSFEMRIIGGGDLDQRLRSMVHDFNLQDIVKFMGFLPPKEVKENMIESDIFLFTSDFNEGWGAVLNESMSSGCAVVASHAIGAAPFLIRDGENGFLYENGNIDHLFERVKTLMDAPDLRTEMGIHAYKDMFELWCPQVAAERLIELSNAIRNGSDSQSLFLSGPCSKANIIKNNWYSR